MSPSQPPTPDLEDILDRFEDAWANGGRPRIEDYLPAGPVQREQVLIELIHVDLELRLKAGESVRVEEYLARYPELCGTNHAMSLMLREAELRRRQNPALRSDEIREPIIDLSATIAKAPTVASLDTTPSAPSGTQALPAGLASIQGYEVQGVLGRGGMGVVLRARHLVLDRLVAIKMPLPGQLTGEADRERFLREARAAARLRHPNICPIHEVGEHDGRPYLAMSYIHGSTLRDWAGRTRPTGRQCAEMVAVLARAVAHAHQHGVIHRDIKPGNVMVDAETGQPVLMDFGLAKELSETASHVTQTGQVMGTPAYMAPEQAAGHSHRIGPAADVYALGAVLYDLLCGRPPFVGSVGEVLRQVQTDEPPVPRKLVPQLHRDLETICLKAIAKDPAARYPSALALAEDLERFSAGEAILARREMLPARLWRRVRRSPVTAGLLAVVVLAVALTGYAVVRVLQSDQAAVLRGQLDHEILADDWSGDHLNAMEAIVTQIEAVSPDRAVRARRDLYDEVGKSVQEVLQRPTIEQGDIDRIEPRVRWLEPRAAEQASALRREVKQRLRAWETLVDLWADPGQAGAGQMRAAYADLGSVFDLGHVRHDGPAFLSRSPASDRRGAVITTRVPSVGTVRLSAIVDGSWESASHLGLLLEAAGDHGYGFQLLADASDAGATFAAVRRGGGSFALRISRNGVPLRTQAIPADRLPAGELRLVATRQHDELTLQVNNLEALKSRDIFPLGAAEKGVFALDWPEGVRLTHVQAQRLALSTTPSPLERGDEEYARGRFDAALAAYQAQALSSGASEAGQEARVKQGLCLLALGRTDEAATLFEQVAEQGKVFERTGSSASPWPLMAICQLWLVRLKQDRFADAESIFTALSTHYRFDELAVLLPDDFRGSILTRYRQENSGINYLKPNPARVQALRRVIDVEMYFNMPEWAAHTYQLLIRAHRLMGQNDEALAVAQKLLGQEKVANNIPEEYGWVLREKGEAARAVPEIERRLYEAPGAYRKERLVLLVERARIHVALGEWEAADKAVDAFLERFKPGEGGSEHYLTSACLMQGCLRERRGDADGALRAWKRGWQAAAPLLRSVGPNSLLTYSGTGAIFLNTLILGSLSGEMTDTEAERLLAWAFASQSADSALTVLKDAFRLPPSVLREMWRSPRGRDCARKIAFQTVSFAEYVRTPVILTAYELIRQDAMPKEPTADQDVAAWQTCEGLLGLFVEGNFSKAQALQLLLTWKGTTGFLGWGALKATLKPAVRGPLAYVLGHRFVKLEKPKEAEAFFRTALDDAPQDSALRRLAQKELDRLAGKP